MVISKEQVVKDIQGMETVLQNLLTQKQQIDTQKEMVEKSIEQQSGGIQYARHLLASLEKAEEEKVPAGETAPKKGKKTSEPTASTNGKPEEEVTL